MTQQLPNVWLLCVQGAVLVTVKKAANLPAADGNGLSDPYVRMVLDDKKRHTTIQRRTLNPKWNERHEWLEVRPLLPCNVYPRTILIVSDCAHCLLEHFMNHL